MSTTPLRGIHVSALGGFELRWKDIKDNAIHGLADERATNQSKALDNCFQLLSRQTVKGKKKDCLIRPNMKQSRPW